ncbi:MAG: hypothetical protein ACI32W_08760 [Enterococcus faecalis]
MEEKELVKQVQIERIKRLEQKKKKLKQEQGSLQKKKTALINCAKHRNPFFRFWSFVWQSGDIKRILMLNVFLAVYSFFVIRNWIVGVFAFFLFLFVWLGEFYIPDGFSSESILNEVERMKVEIEKKEEEIQRIEKEIEEQC